MRVLGSLGAGTGSAHSWGFPVPSVPLPTQGPAGTGPARPVSPSRGWHTVRNPSRGSVTPPAVVSLLIPVGPRATPGTPTPLRHRSRASPCHPPRQATVTAARGGWVSPPVPGTPETPPRSGRVDHQSLSRVVSPGRARAMSFPPLALFSSRSDVVSGAIPKLCSARGIPGSTGRGLPCPVLGTGAAPRDPKDLPAVSPPARPRCPRRGEWLSPRSPRGPRTCTDARLSPGQCRAAATSAGRALPPPALPHAGPWRQPMPHLRGDLPAPLRPLLPPAGPPLPSPARLYWLGSTQAELPPQEPFPGDPSGLRDTGTRSGCPCHHPRGDPGGPRLDPRAGWARGRFGQPRGWAGPPRAPRGAAAARGGRAVPWGPGKAGKGTARRRRPKAQRSSSGQCQHRDCEPSWGQRPPR